MWFRHRQPVWAPHERLVFGGWKLFFCEFRILSSYIHTLSYKSRCWNTLTIADGTGDKLLVPRYLVVHWLSVCSLLSLSLRKQAEGVLWEDVPGGQRRWVDGGQPGPPGQRWRQNTGEFRERVWQSSYYVVLCKPQFPWCNHAKVTVTNTPHCLCSFIHPLLPAWVISLQSFFLLAKPNLQ